MAIKSRATQCGSYVCKVGEYDVRHKVVQPKVSRNFKGEKIQTPGSVTAGVYHGRDLLKGGFNDHTKAIKYIWEQLKKDGIHYSVSKRVIKKYNLN